MNQKEKPFRSEAVVGSETASNGSKLNETMSLSYTKSTQNSQDHSLSHQRFKILGFLRKYGSLTTLQARQILGICAPAARIMELRRQGLTIDTLWTNDIDSTGQVHKVANYVLSGRRGVES